MHASDACIPKNLRALKVEDCSPAQGPFPRDFVPWGLHFSGYVHESVNSERQRNECAMYAACPEAILLKYHCINAKLLSKL